MGDIAIIPARGGSKRIPGKNIKLFRGKPIIAYSIEQALTSGLFDEVMVSTDNETIADVARKYGASVPFMRSEANANDFAGTVDVVLEVLGAYKIRLGNTFGNGCCIYPTAPFVNADILSSAKDLLYKENFDVVFPITAFSYPILRGLTADRRNKVEMLWPENLEKRSQDLAPVYHDAGQFYWFKTDKLLEEKKMFGDNSGGIIVDELAVQDIDNESDWKIAEIKHSILYPRR